MDVAAWQIFVVYSEINVVTCSRIYASALVSIGEGDNMAVQSNKSNYGWLDACSGSPSRGLGYPRLARLLRFYRGTTRPSLTTRVICGDHKLGASCDD
jgi:hypothetical protein